MEDKGIRLDELSAPAVTVRRRRVAFPDLKAVVHLDEAPAELLAELPELYSSAFSIAEYFAIYDRPRRMYACELDEPHHVIVFTSHGATAEVLNKVIEIEPAAVERLAAAIFRARPEIRRIRAEVKFAPPVLGLPVRELHRSDDQVVELPATGEAFERRLGASTRKKLRNFRNRLQRAHPDFNLRTVEGEEITLALVEQVFDWNKQRIIAKGGRWGFENEPGAPYKAWRWLRSHGAVLCGYMGEECVAAELLLFVGRDCWALRGGFDPIYSDVDLGFLMSSFLIVESIQRGCARTHLLFGASAYKQHLGAVPVTAYRVSIFRSRFDKVLYAREPSPFVKEHRTFYQRARRAFRRRLLAAFGDETRAR